MQPGVLLPQGRSLHCVLGSPGRWSFGSLSCWPSEASANNGFMFHHIRSSPLESGLGAVLWPLQWCARVAEMRSAILEMTPMWLLLRSVAQVSLEAPRCTTLLCASCSFLLPLPEVQSAGGLWVSSLCVRWAAGWQRAALVVAAVTPPCYWSCWRGVALPAAPLFLDTKEATPRSSKLPAPQTGASKPLALQKGPASVSLGEASTDTLPLYSK